MDQVLAGDATPAQLWAEVDIDADQELTAEYGLRIPVVLLDGVEHGYWRVDQARLLRDLAAPTGEPGGDPGRLAGSG